MEIKLTDSNYKDILINSEEPILIDFFASWCGPCKMASPVVEKLANDLEGKVKVCKCNVDENPTLASKFGVQSIPLFVVIKDNKVTNQALGFHNYDQLKALLDK